MLHGLQVRFVSSPPKTSFTFSCFLESAALWQGVEGLFLLTAGGCASSPAMEMERHTLETCSHISAENCFIVDDQRRIPIRLRSVSGLEKARAIDKQ